MDGIRPRKPKIVPTKYPPSQPTNPVYATQLPKKAPFLPRKISWLAPSLFLLVTFTVFATLGYFSWRIGRATRSMSIAQHENGILAETVSGSRSVIASISSLIQKDHLRLRGESEGRTNILVLGKANTHVAGQNLTDTIMIVSIDFSNRKIAILSLPRDLYVELPNRGIATKLNAFYQYDLQNNSTEADIVREAVSVVSGIPIHYFLTIDYDGFSDAVDTLGGISVYVERTLVDDRFPGPNYSYETFEIREGWQDLDGPTALKYVRERHADPDGDFGRAKRQQDVLSAIRDKILSAETYLNPLTISRIIDIVGNHLKTNLPIENPQGIIALARDLDTKNISAAVLDAWKQESLLRVSHIPIGPISMFILVPRTGNWSETRELARNIFDLDALRKESDAVKLEAASIGIRNESGVSTLSEQVRSFLSQDLHLNRVSILPTEKSFTLREKSEIVGFGGTRAAQTIQMLKEKLSLQDNQNSFDTSEKKSDYDIILSLGKDLSDRFSFSRDLGESIRDQESDPTYEEQLNLLLTPKPKTPTDKQSN